MTSTRQLGLCWHAVGFAVMAALFFSFEAPAQTVVNGDFETDTELFVAWPGYLGHTTDAGTNPAAIVGWTSSGQTGINPVVPGGEGDSPFRDNGDNLTSVALLQGAASIEQVVSGFGIGQEYTLSLDFNARNCCGGALPLATIELNGIVAGSSIDLFPPSGAVPPVGGSEPWYHADISFTAPTTDITLLIRSEPIGGDATLVVDNVAFSLVPEPATGLLAVGALLSFVCAMRRRE